MTTSLGIAITTYNSCELVMRQVSELRRLTRTDFELVVADDGSTDGTVSALRALGVPVIAGTNRGVAWNKNRGLFHLLNKTDCKLVLLLDDDILPVVEGWERDWVETIERFGHVNYMLPSFAAQEVIAGQMTVASPGLATSLFGPLIGFTREACAYVGYFEIRFGRWGFEHVDFTNRFVRLGYGGLSPGRNRYQRQLYVVLSSGVELQNRVSAITAEEKAQLITSGRKVLARSESEPAYRCPWNNEEEMRYFRAELDGDNDAHPQSTYSDGEYASLFADVVSVEEATRQRLVDTPSRRLFMIHIPKTAGDSINHLLTEMLGTQHVLTHVERSPGLLTRLRSIPPEVRYVSGHHRLPDVLANMDRSEWFVFVNLRNPVEHLISHLKWVKMLGDPDDEAIRAEHSPVIQEMARRLWEISLNDIESIERFINEEFDEAKQLFDNCQVRYLIDYRDRLISQRDAVEAVAALDKIDYVGLTENLSNTYSIIADAVGRNINIYSTPDENVDPLGEAVDLRDPAILDFYRVAVRMDAFLYTAARGLSEEGRQPLLST